VARNVKFPSSPTQADRSTAETVGLREDRREEELSDDTKYDKKVRSSKNRKIPDFLKFLFNLFSLSSENF